VGTYLTEAELAKRTTTSPARIERLVEIGVLRSDASGRFSPADIQRVQIAAAYEAGGIELEHIAQAISERRMSFEYSDRIYPEASPPSGRTVGELAAELGHDGDLLPDLFTALGLPRPTPDRPLTSPRSSTPGGARRCRPMPPSAQPDCWETRCAERPKAGWISSWRPSRCIPRTVSR
jgi:DNA-binding transcriptional MerR regulator